MERFWLIGRDNQWRGQLELFPRRRGPFIRPAKGSKKRDLVVGQWGLIPVWEKKSVPRYATFNARSEELAAKPAFRLPWARGQRCIVPATSFYEPCWETGKNVWWRFRRADGAPWGLAGLWNTWVDLETGEIHESYTMLTINADHHPLMSRMHKPEPDLPPDGQDKRSVVPIELADTDQWLLGTNEEAEALVKVPALELFDAEPELPQSSVSLGTARKKGQ